MLRLRDIMNPDVPVVSSDSTLQSALAWFAAHRLTGALVVEGATAVGVVAASDVLAYTPSVPCADAGDDSASPSAYFTGRWSELEPDVASQLEESALATPGVLAECLVSEVMTRSILALPPDTLLAVADEYMRRVNARRLLVLSERTLEGVVTAKDVARAASGHAHSGGRRRTVGHRRLTPV